MRVATGNGVRTSWENTAMDEVKIWAIQDRSKAVALESKSQVDTEGLLEETLVANPNLLIPGLRLVGRQTPTEGGPLDLLGVDEDGRLVVFELKRGTLSRDAVAQIIDYASDLDSKSDVELAEHIAANSGVGSIENIDDFEQWYGELFPDSSLDSLTPLRLFLVGLGADKTTERMVRFLADNSGMDISLITFHGFAYEGKTLLAKQVEVEGTAEPGRAPSDSERLERRIQESRVSELFDAVRYMFKRNWCDLWEHTNVGSLRFSLWEDTRWRAYARIAPSAGKVLIIFYTSAFTLCPTEFDQAKQAIQNETWGSEAWPELVFPLDAAGWETHKERLHALTRAVYEAWENRDQEQNTA